MATRNLLILFIAVAALACSGGSGTNPFLDQDAGAEDSGTAETGDEECQGCVDSTGACVDGDSNDACGTEGRSCVTCLEDQVCTDEGVCVDTPDCTPDTCDGCCDSSGACVDGNDDMACGRSGLPCSACAADSSCVEGACQRECGPDSCPGCCNAEGECLSGATDTSCGMGGGACTDCASIGAECDDNGTCVEAGCAASCDGCCNEGECVNPTFDAQCGVDGEACVDCGDRACIDGGCTVDPASLWKVFVANGEVAEDADGGPWDGVPAFPGLPDPYVNAIAIDPNDDERHENWTETADDTLSPVWDEAPITVAARALFDGLTLEYIDDDVADDDLICTIEVEFDEESPAFDGGLIESECPENPESKIRWRLQPQ